MLKHRLCPGCVYVSKSGDPKIQISKIHSVAAGYVGRTNTHAVTLTHYHSYTLEPNAMTPQTTNMLLGYY
jgi:hypothetical protein